jgi:hypothetical protein
VLSSIKNPRFQEFCFYEQEFQITWEMLLWHFAVMTVQW